MAKRVIDDATLTAVADCIRTCLMSEDTYKPTDMSKAIEDIYFLGESNGYSFGYVDGTQDGIEQGKQAQHDEFWDTFQENGNRTNYEYGFAGYGWTSLNFKPKHNIKPNSATNMFQSTRNLNIDLRDLEITIDFSNCTSLTNVLANSSISGVGVIDARKATNTTAMFNYNWSLQVIEKLILKSDGSQTFVNAFQSNNALTTINIEGVIGNDISFAQSPLSKESITSVVEHLSTTETGKTLTLKKTAVNSAFETSEGLSDGSTSAEWTALSGTKPNWTISLV